MALGSFSRILASMTSAMITSARHFSEASHKYIPIPSNLQLQHIVVVHRHGDRSQITRELGPNFPENDTVTAKWRTLMPTTRAMRSMMLTTSHGHQLGDDVSVETELYGGWDSAHAPYAQLTDVGHQQLVEVGRTMRARYHQTLNLHNKLILPDNIESAYDHLYCRSTHMCRTTQSLRSLLVGMFENDVNPDHPHHNDPQHKPTHVLPHIHTRATKLEETLFPSPSPNGAMTAKRKKLLSDAMASNSIEGYEALHDKLKRAIGGELVNWVVVKEVLTCHSTHNISVLSPGVSEQELAKIDEIAGWIWGVMFKDKELNRFAIGRFLHEMLLDMRAAMNKQSDVNTTIADNSMPSDGGTAATSTASVTASSSVDRGSLWDAAHARSKSSANKTALFYSGHDSTLVPVLCALELYTGAWPPYASHLTFELAKRTAAVTADVSRANDDDKDGKEEETMYVRAVYNDIPMQMFPLSRAIENELGLNPDMCTSGSVAKCASTSATIASTASGNASNSGDWMPFPEFELRLREISLSPEEYAQEEKAAALLVQEAEVTARAARGGATTTAAGEGEGGAATLEK